MMYKFIALALWVGVVCGQQREAVPPLSSLPSHQLQRFFDLAQRHRLLAALFSCDRPDVSLNVDQLAQKASRHEFNEQVSVTDVERLIAPTDQRAHVDVCPRELLKQPGKQGPVCAELHDKLRAKLAELDALEAKARDAQQDAAQRAEDAKRKELAGQIRKELLNAEEAPQPGFLERVRQFFAGNPR